ncbi:U6 snRNA phosphodiesterase [Colletotrichum orbiculare MAFF 240422]|uniref:U6 snRNA phosphodiesterase n=1 Tax=Colletotrichum orbiculare (strain 104-T / ATCC 96160 / CBS 514.97 / LARS 414 / MAFF 240422) TaxID=1213857 RepID=N4V8G9_COLOR|nr:U6 snRNA phosphodiesterase [Colletotrichum orbiculare MAFF 240422]
MALVDYSSSDSQSEAASPPAKRRKGADPETHDAKPDRDATGTNKHDLRLATSAGNSSSTAKRTDGTSALPPLPDEFYDLYASTVRTTTADDPALHQGRKRAIPHIAGHWPSHVYVEWHPTTSQYELLTALLDKIGPLLKSQKLYPLLTSDLNTPLPLHISLSRPLSLPTAQKDDFLASLTSTLSSATAPFTLFPIGLGFFKSPDSDRAFLVLRVANPAAAASKGSSDSTHGKNPQLRALLVKANTIALNFGQPPLYDAHATELVDDAFHVSIGWTFGLPAEDACLATYGVLRTGDFRGIRDWEITVSGVKAKIGNTVTHIPLRDGKQRKQTGAGVDWILS